MVGGAARHDCLAMPELVATRISDVPRRVFFERSSAGLLAVRLGTLIGAEPSQQVSLCRVAGSTDPHPADMYADSEQTLLRWEPNITDQLFVSYRGVAVWVGCDS